MFFRLTYFFAAIIIVHANNVCVQPTEDSATQSDTRAPLKKDTPKALRYLTTIKEKIEASLIESEDCLWPNGNKTYRQAMLHVLRCSNYRQEHPSPATNQCAALLEDYVLALSRLSTELLEQNNVQVDGCTKKTLLALNAAIKDANEAEVIFQSEVANLVTFIKNDFLPPSPIYPKKTPLMQRTRSYAKSFIEEHKTACKVAAAAIVLICAWALWRKYKAPTTLPQESSSTSSTASTGTKTTPTPPVQTPTKVIECPAVPRQNGGTQCGYHSSCNSKHAVKKLKEARDKKGSKLTQEEIIALMRSLTTDLTDAQTQALLDEAKKTLGHDNLSTNETIAILEDANLPATARIEERRSAFRADVNRQMGEHRVLLQTARAQLAAQEALTKALRDGKEAYDSEPLEAEKNRLATAIKAHEDTIGALQKNLNEGACLDGNGVLAFVRFNETQNPSGIEYDTCNEELGIAWQQCEISNSPTPERLAAARRILKKLKEDPTLAQKLKEAATALKSNGQWPEQPQNITLASGIRLNEIQELVDITQSKERWPTELKLINWFQQGYTLVLNWLDHAGHQHPGSVGHWTAKVIAADAVKPHAFHLDSFGFAPSASFNNLLAMIVDPTNLFTDDDIQKLKSVIPE